jgi:molybdate transport system substrate-binding protein
MMRRQRGAGQSIVVAGLLAVCLLSAAGAAELAVLSAGAIEPGVRPALAAFEKQTGHAVRVTFNTAPQIRKRMAEGEAWDVVIAPPVMIEELVQSRKADGARVDVGRVGLGVVIRADADVPDISSADTFQKSLLQAESLVFNRASTGVYLEGLLRKQGIYERLQAKSTRYPDGAAVMEHVLHGKGREIGFGAITEILLYRDKGLKLVGPLPADIQNYTAYSATALTGAANRDLVTQFLNYLGSPAGKSLFRDAGIEP